MDMINYILDARKENDTNRLGLTLGINDLFQQMHQLEMVDMFEDIYPLFQLENAIKIDVNNVRDYVKCQHDRDQYAFKKFNDDWTKYSFKPPYRNMWMECDGPYDNGIRFGLHFSMITPAKANELLSIINAQFNSFPEDEDGEVSIIQSFRMESNIPTLTSMGYIYHDKDGMSKSLMIHAGMMPVPFETRMDEMQRRDELTWITFPIIYALMLCHCKNTGLVVHRKPSHIKQSMRKRKKKSPLYEFKRVNIESILIKSIPSGNKTDIKHAMHTCCGHFKTYTKERPLMGKHVGTYWFAPHIRGSRSEGIIEKEYVVQPV